MKMYVGTKSLMAEPMTLGTYNKLRGWKIPENEDPNTDGYFVEYEDGYQSWSPKPQFEDAYNSNTFFTFGQALWLLERGHLLARSGWNGKNMYLFHVDGDGNWQPHICMMTVQQTIVPWLASHTDMLAEDWSIVTL